MEGKSDDSKSVNTIPPKIRGTNEQDEKKNYKQNKRSVLYWISVWESFLID